jgi:hypothetical protein
VRCITQELCEHVKLSHVEGVHEFTLQLTVKSPPPSLDAVAVHVVLDGSADGSELSPRRDQLPPLMRYLVSDAVPEKLPLGGRPTTSPFSTSTVQ